MNVPISLYPLQHFLLFSIFIIVISVGTIVISWMYHIKRFSKKEYDFVFTCISKQEVFLLLVDILPCNTLRQVFVAVVVILTWALMTSCARYFLCVCVGSICLYIVKFLAASLAPLPTDTSRTTCSCDN